jgi:polyribonucleotide 5'-hydroxyl-kinase
MDQSQGGASSSAAPSADLPEAIGERHTLEPQEELRVEIPFGTATTQITLQKGSCELWGCELGLGKTYSIANGGIQLALFTWHGCVVDVSGNVEISYTSEETDANVAFVNTHAQLEALRDEALSRGGQGPRVMIVGPPESGKSSLTKTLVAYACKVGRTPLWVDLDPHDNAISVPGTLSVAPMTSAAITVETYATCGIPPNTVHPLVLWHGTSKGSSGANTLNVDLFQAQVDRLAASINARFNEDEQAKASGIIVNTNGWIQDDGYKCLLHAAEAMDISVVLIMGHDRLYSMMTNHYNKQPEVVQVPKVLKLPRSGGVVSRPDAFLRSARSRSVKRYFYGDLVDAPKTTDTTTTSSASTSNDRSGPSKSSLADTITVPSTAKQQKVPQLTPFLLQVPFADISIYKLSSMALSSSLLPVAQQQTTDAIQIEEVAVEEALQHALVAVCHPLAVQTFAQTGRGRDLWTSGVAGFCAVERVLTDSDTLHLLSPCAGSLPSKTLLLGDVTWME